MPKSMFIVQARSRQPSGILKVVKADRREALNKAKEFLNDGLPFVTIVADGTTRFAGSGSMSVGTNSRFL